MQLSKNFYLSEFVSSQTAARHKIDNTPTKEIIVALKALIVSVLQPVRDAFDLPVVVTSGYRSPAVNRLIKGSATSQHMRGQAADFVIPGVPHLEVARYIQNNLVFDQLILEFYNPKNPNSGWVHCSFAEGRNRKSVLTFNGSKYISQLV